MTVNMMEAQESAEPSRKLPKHEFSIYGLGGLAGLNYKLSEGGTQSNSAGGGAGFGYTFNLNSNWGITLGAEIEIYGSKATYGALSGEYEYGTAGTWEHLRFHYSVSGYEEQQRITQSSIPVMLQFKTSSGGTACFYIAGGVKIGSPLSAKATITSGRATTSGEFSYEQVEYSDLAEYGFVDNLPLAETKSKIALGASVALALESGVRFPLSSNIALYTGAFLDYGLNDIRSATDKHVIGYQTGTPSVFEHNSILNSVRTDKVNIFSAGLKIKIAFSTN
jgi:hypothetical protein